MKLEPQSICPRDVLTSASGAEFFPRVPAGWYYACQRKDLERGPVGWQVGSAQFVAFLDESGRPSVLDARCSHMSADLSRGRVYNGILRCPLHGWEYGGDGRCTRIPAATNIPAFAIQTRYPTSEIGGHVVYFNAPSADYAMPFYESLTPDQLQPAKPFEIDVQVPWHMIAANAFDLQHLHIVHDRALLDTPVIDSPAPSARRISANYAVSGTSLRDRMTRRFSGAQVRMSVTVWGGTLVLVTAAFRKTTSYGMVFVQPLDGERTRLRTIVWVPCRRKGGMIRRAMDRADAAVRRQFIRAFMMDDTLRSSGIRYNPATLIEADRELSEYFHWLADLAAAPVQHSASACFADSAHSDGGDNGER